jgi:hypothetical protein
VGGQRPPQHTILPVLTADASQEISRLRIAPVTAGPEFSSMREIIFDQQPSKQPLAQNKNGSRFGCLASY